MLDILVVDDEPLARKSMQLSLAKIGEHKPAREAQSADEALLALEANCPDLLFLDIEMPGMNGIELAQQVCDRCEIIFVTAYNEYAVEAFKLNAIDYLLKPVNYDRLRDALEKARRRIMERRFTDYKKVAELIRQLQSEKQDAFSQRITVKDNGRILMLDADQISHITGAGNYTQIHLLDGSSFMHRATMTEMETQLDPAQFLRIHRSIIVRRKSVLEMRTSEKGDYIIELKCGKKLHLSRRHKEKFNALID